MRICTSCKKFKSINDFYTFKRNGKILPSWWCKECHLDKGKVRYRANKGVYKERQRKWFLKNRQKSYEYQAKWRRKNREKLNKRNAEHARIYSKILREGVIKEYGKKCRCCGVIEIEFLTIDHINGGGNKHRKEIGESFMVKFFHRE